MHLPFTNQSSHFLHQPAFSVSSLASLSSFDLHPQTIMPFSRRDHTLSTHSHSIAEKNIIYRFPYLFLKRHTSRETLFSHWAWLCVVWRYYLFGDVWMSPGCGGVFASVSEQLLRARSVRPTDDEVPLWAVLDAELAHHHSPIRQQLRWVAGCGGRCGRHSCCPCAVLCPKVTVIGLFAERAGGQHFESRWCSLRVKVAGFPSTLPQKLRWPCSPEYYPGKLRRPDCPHLCPGRWWWSDSPQLCPRMSRLLDFPQLFPESDSGRIPQFCGSCINSMKCDCHDEGADFLKQEYFTGTCTLLTMFVLSWQAVDMMP